MLSFSDCLRPMTSCQISHDELMFTSQHKSPASFHVPAEKHTLVWTTNFKKTEVVKLVDHLYESFLMTCVVFFFLRGACLQCIISSSHLKNVFCLLEDGLPTWGAQPMVLATNETKPEFFSREPGSYILITVGFRSCFWLRSHCKPSC